MAKLFLDMTDCDVPESENYEDEVRYLAMLKLVHSRSLPPLACKRQKRK